MSNDDFNDNIVEQKSLDFAKRIVNLYIYLSKDKKEYVLSKQILRSGTSIGANIAEAQFGISKKDFLAKMYISYKETAETIYWLKLLRYGDYISEKAFNSLNSDCTELIKLLTSITKTIKNEEK